jgi:hypothetical protein
MEKITINIKELAKQEGFKIAIRPLLKYINDYCNPHTTVIVNATGAELLSGEISINNFDFVKD